MKSRSTISFLNWGGGPLIAECDRGGWGLLFHAGFNDVRSGERELRFRFRFRGLNIIFMLFKLNLGTYILER